MKKVLKLCFLAPTGFGKTTAVNIIKNIYNSNNIKLAEPLYDIQNYIYSKIGIDIKTKQDGELLQFLGSKIQKENPKYLAEEFYTKMLNLIDNSGAQIITNDDCRTHNYQYLKRWGFKFVKINGFSRIREDHTKINSNHPVEWIMDEITYDYILENMGDLNDYRNNIIKLMEEFRYV